MKGAMKKVVVTLLAALVIWGEVPQINSYAAEACITTSNIRNFQTKTIGQSTSVEGTLTVDDRGKLIIPEDVVLTIRDGATLIINGTADIRGKVVVEHGGRFYRKEYGVFQELIGPVGEKGFFTPLLRSYIGSIEVRNNEIHLPTGSTAHVARSSVRLWNEKWTMEHESELTYDDNVAVNVTITGPDFSQNQMQYARIVYGFGSCNTKTHAMTPNTYYYLYDRSSDSGVWVKFDGLAALSGTTEGATEIMLQWANVFYHNAGMIEPELTGEEGRVLRNQVYNDTRNTRNTYNLFIPSTVEADKPVSLILFTHGGSWTSGEKESMDYACARYARMGYITADIDYRLFQAETNAATSMDDIMTDMEQCVSAINTQVSEMGYTIDGMATSGYSAGGHLALLYGYSRKDSSEIPVKLVIDQVGPADFAPASFAPGLFQSSLAFNMFAKVMIPGYDTMDEQQKTDALAHISPTAYVNHETVPTVMTYASQDIIVGYQHGVVLDQLLSENQVEHAFYTLSKSNHTCEYDSETLAEFNQTSIEYCEKYLNSAN